MIVPGVIFVLIAIGMKLNCWDALTEPRFSTADTGKTSKASMWDYVECLKDPRIDIMILQYGACFGTELTMNAQLAMLGPPWTDSLFTSTSSPTTRQLARRSLSPSTPSRPTATRQQQQRQRHVQLLRPTCSLNTVIGRPRPTASRSWACELRPQLAEGALRRLQHHHQLHAVRDFSGDPTSG